MLALKEASDIGAAGHDDRRGRFALALGHVLDR